MWKDKDFNEEVDIIDDDLLTACQFLNSPFTYSQEFTDNACLHYVNAEWKAHGSFLWDPWFKLSHILC